MGSLCFEKYIFVIRYVIRVKRLVVVLYNKKSVTVIFMEMPLFCRKPVHVRHGLPELLD